MDSTNARWTAKTSCGSEDSLDSAFSSPSLLGSEDTETTPKKSVRRNLEAQFDSSSKKQRISKVLSTSSPALASRKLIRDVIYPNIEAHELCLKITCTPHVRRLRKLKQLGTAYLVYPSAISSRYNHSLGVMHLARCFLTELRKHCGDDILDEKDILCAEVAGLLHDVGHGSFSHMFEAFLARVGTTVGLKHEETSLILIDEIFQLQEIQYLLLKYNLTERDKICIKEMVAGKPLDGGTEYRGRDKDKIFLLRLVNNGLNGLDVDKIDYLLRDSASIGESCTELLDRLLKNIRVVRTEDGSTELAFMKKVDDDLKAVASKRMSLHKKLYQHRKVKIFDEMFIDMMVAADPFLLFQTRSGGAVPLSQVTSDTVAFLRTYDEEILRRIEESTEPGMLTAQQLLNRINWRDCYKIVGSEELGLGDQDLHQLKTSFQTFVDQHSMRDLNLGLLQIKISSGLVGNSLDNFFFIDKNSEEVAPPKAKFPVERTLVCFTRAEYPGAALDGEQFFKKFVGKYLMNRAT